MKKRILTSILAVFLLFGISAAAAPTAAQEDDPYLIPGWDQIPGWRGPWPEGYGMFRTEDLSLHGGFSMESGFIFDSRTAVELTHFMFYNSSDKAITLLEPFHIYLRVYPANDVGGKIVYQHEVPVLAGVLPPHSFFSTSGDNNLWYGTDNNNRMLPNGKYVMCVEMDDHFIFSFEGDNTVQVRDVGFVYAKQESLEVNAQMQRAFSSYLNPPPGRMPQK